MYDFVKDELELFFEDEALLMVPWRISARTPHGI